MEIPFLFDIRKNLKDESFFISFSKIEEIKNFPLYFTDKYDFIAMLNIMYEDKYLSYFKSETNGDYPEEIDLDAKDVKDEKAMEKYQNRENFLTSFKNSFIFYIDLIQIIEIYF